MMKREQPQPPRGRALSIRKRLAFSAVVVSAFVLALYVGSICIRSIGFYRVVKDRQYGWRGKVLASDPMLGYCPIPGSAGIELVPQDPGIPGRFDADGFRIPFDQPIDCKDGSPSVLTLGCSYTYGLGCPAEETFPSLLSRSTGSRVMNGGTSGYGLAHMLILAQRMIPKHRPNYVVVQFSPWLVLRAQCFYAWGHQFETVPVPYFWETSAGELQVHPPTFRSKLLTISVDPYRAGPASTGDFLSFLLKASGPLLIHDDINILAHRLKRIAGIIPPPSADQPRIVRFAYAEIGALCREYGARMLVLILGSNPNPVDYQGVDRIPGVTIVDAHTAMLERLPERTEDAYRRKYGHWKGDPPVFVDYHPNATAHRIIAGELARFIVPKVEDDR
jgi:hypothetical protein